MLLNKSIENFTHKRWENQCSKFFGFFTALLVDRHKRGRLRHRGETKGYRTTKVNLNNLEIEISKQNKHLENTNEYKVSLANGQQKSIITVSLDSLKGYVGTGQQVGKTEIGLPGSKERVNFNKNIGIYIDPVTGNQTPTTMGIIHYSKNGYHVVPAKPKE